MIESAFAGYMVEDLLHGMPLLDSSGDGFGLPSCVQKKPLNVLILTFVSSSTT